MEATINAKQAEALIAQVLKQQGWHILRQNYRILRSEIDIIAKKGGTLSFVEVKLRQNKYQHCINYNELLTNKKRACLKRGALHFISKTKIEYDMARFDLAVIFYKKERHTKGGLDLKIEYHTNI